MLLTKLHIPPAGNNVVHRSELFEKLNSGLSRKLILVSAPAGYGKTTLISDWISQNKIPAAWLSLDNGDNDPAVFLSYVIAGIEGIHHSFGQSALRLLKSPNSPSVESITNLLINDVLNIIENILLVLDDFHMITSSEVLKLATYILEHIPGNIHIVILTRSDPALAVSKLRSQHQLVELRSSDLGFSANDISILFNKRLKLGLSVEDAYSLESKTEGWIAGLQLTALSMSGRKDISGFIKDLKGDNRYIMDYLMEEVLKTQTDEIKEFLLQTSILDQMSAPLCNDVLNRNDSQLILETLERSNMFVIPLDEDRNWYRYHHLFAELLKHRLHLRDKSTIIGLHNKAIEWFNSNSMPLLAIKHAIETKNFEKSIQLLGDKVETMWKNGQHSAIRQYGDLLPDELIKKNADFCLYYAWILIIAGQVKKAEPFLESAGDITMQIINDKSSSKADILNSKKTSGKISVAFAYLYSILKDSEKTFSYSKAAMENLSEADPMWYSWGWYSIGIAEMYGENFNECINAFEKALEYGKKSGNVYLISTIASRLSPIEARMGLYSSSYKRCSDLISFMKESGYSQITKSESTYAGVYSMMSGIESMRLDFDNALENIKIAYDLCKNESNNTIKVHVLMVYALALYGRGDLAGVNRMINEADNILKHNTVFPTTMSIYISMKGFILIELNEIEKATHHFKENGLEFDNKITYSYEHGYIDFARLLIIQKRFSEAEIILSKLLTMAVVANRIERIIETKVIYAILNKATGDNEMAIKNLIEALEDAASENILMSFVLFHSELSDLLKKVYKIVATSKTRIPEVLIDKLKLAIERREIFIKTNSESVLSDRELDILRLISEDLTNQEIADRLFISPNTTKTHVKNIFLKLAVDSRIHAVTKAKELGII